MLKVRRVVRPGDKGTLNLVKQYGEQLVCVRYRYDYQKNISVKTIELIIGEEPWTPPPPHPREEERPVTKSTCNTQRVPVRIDRHEYGLQQQIKAIGGKWSFQDKLWYASEYHVYQIGLGDRIVKRR